MLGVVSISKVVVAVISPISVVGGFVTVKVSSSLIAVMAVVAISVISVVGTEIAVVPPMVSDVVAELSMVLMSPSEVVIVVAKIAVMLASPVSIMSPMIAMGSVISVVGPAPVAMMVIVVEVVMS